MPKLYNVYADAEQQKLGSMTSFDATEAAVVVERLLSRGNVTVVTVVDADDVVENAQVGRL